jgi:hypothetical protein
MGFLYLTHILRGGEDGIKIFQRKEFEVFALRGL